MCLVRVSARRGPFPRSMRPYLFSVDPPRSPDWNESVVPVIEIRTAPQRRQTRRAARRASWSERGRRGAGAGGRRHSTGLTMGGGKLEPMVGFLLRSAALHHAYTSGGRKAVAIEGLI